MTRASYFEIPVLDFNRAVQFYQAVFGIQLEITTIDGHQMALFPDAAGGVSGALAHGDSYVPSLDGTRIYFAVQSIDDVLAKVRLHGGRKLYPKTSIGEPGFVAEFEDSEGNRIALNAPI